MRSEEIGLDRFVRDVVHGSKSKYFMIRNDSWYHGLLESMPSKLRVAKYPLELT